MDKYVKIGEDVFLKDSIISLGRVTSSAIAKQKILVEVSNGNQFKTITLDCPENWSIWDTQREVDDVLLRLNKEPEDKKIQHFK